MGRFPQTSPASSGFFAKRDLQLETSYVSRHPVEKHQKGS